MENITGKKIFITLLVVFFFGLYFSHWIRCYLDNRFFFSSLDLNLRIIFDVRSDGSMPLLMARLLHNKLTEGSSYLFNTYSNYWDLRFLLYILSPVTFLGFLSWIFYTIKKKIVFSLLQRILVLFSLLLPIVILFGVIKNEIIALSLFSIPFVILSLEGYFTFVKNNKYFWMVFVLAIALSLYMFISLPVNILSFCHI